MKNLITTAILLYTAIATSQSIITVPEDDIRTQFSVLVDPTLTDAGFQFGLEATMIMHWGFVGASVTAYPQLQPNYTDLAGQLGVNVHLFGYDNIRYYTGVRLGRLWRGNNGYVLYGALAGFDVQITRRDAIPRIDAGFKFWIDHRNDQADDQFGDSDAYQRGLITDNPLLQENLAFLVSFSF